MSIANLRGYVNGTPHWSGSERWRYIVSHWLSAYTKLYPIGLDMELGAFMHPDVCKSNYVFWYIFRDASKDWKG